MDQKIPRNIHIIWIGDEQKTPHNCIESWKKMNPLWNLHFWGNQQLQQLQWHNRPHIDRLLEKEKQVRGTEREQKLCFAGIADMMRYEILYAIGGFFVDADSFCMRPLEDWLFDSSLCAPYENEIQRPGLVTNAFLASTPKNDIVLEMISAIHGLKDVTQDEPWLTTGPNMLTNTILKKQNTDITLWPSHYFLPSHYLGSPYTGTGHVFAKHYWGSQISYDEIKTLNG